MEYEEVIYSGGTIKYLTERQTKDVINDRELENELELRDTNKCDLTPNVYEGGFKVWECALDLVKYMDGIEVGGISVYEIGCGAGIPGILAAKKGAKSVDFQDFNKTVIDCFTKENVKLNELEVVDCNFQHGDWSDNQVEIEKSGKRYDMILTSETIYSSQNYANLHSLFDKALSHHKDAYILLGAKMYYFGVGGGVFEFMDFVKEQKCFDCQIVYKTETCLKRFILKLTRLSQA
uniref:MTS domain-containing protein n=1 Tax=Rhabditophanes sp. KR3021 TaxID=114890 RepID=A0AC35TZH0_9BILA